MSKKKHYEVTTADGTECPRCYQVAEKRKHIAITDKQLNQPYYFKYWYNCTNGECKTGIFMLDDWKVFNNNEAAKNFKLVEEDQENLAKIGKLF